MSAARSGSAPTEVAPLGPCLVTGASGFVGSRLGERLRVAGSPVRTVGRRGPAVAGEHWVVDLAAEELPAEACAGVRTVFHLAARTHAAPAAGEEDAYAAVNVAGTRRVLAAALAAGVERLVFVSSVKALGEGGPRRVEEHEPPRPTTAYGRTKLAAERLVHAAGDHLHGVCLRLPLVYGPGQKGNLPRMIAAVRRGFFPPPPRDANRRSMVHVDTVVDALLCVAAEPRAAGQTYVVADPRPYSTREVYEWIHEALGRRAPRWAVPLSVLRAAAAAGDAGGRLLGRSLPFDSAAFDKLLGSAWYGSERIRELGLEARRELRAEMPALVAEHSV